MPRPRGARAGDLQPTAEEILDAATAAALPTPTPLRQARVLARFPTDALPDWAAAWVAAEATATQTPTDLAGCCALGCAVGLRRAAERSCRSGRGGGSRPTSTCCR